jgi:hypothetical protein
MRRRAISSENIAIADHEEGGQITPILSPPSYVSANDAELLFSKLLLIQMYTLHMIVVYVLFSGLMSAVSKFNRNHGNGGARYYRYDMIYEKAEASFDALFIAYFFIHASSASVISEQDVLLIQLGFIGDDRRLDGSSWRITLSYIMINSYLLALFTALSATDFVVAVYSERFLPDTAVLFPILYVGGFILLASKAFNTRTNLVLATMWFLQSNGVAVVAVFIIPYLLIPVMRMLGIANKTSESPPPPRKGWINFFTLVICNGFFSAIISNTGFIFWCLRLYLSSFYFGLSKMDLEHFGGSQINLVVLYSFIYYRHLILLSQEDAVVGFTCDDYRLDAGSERQWQYAAVRRRSFLHIAMSYIMINFYLLALFTALSTIDHCLALYSDRFLLYTATLFPILYFGGFLLYASKTFNTRTNLAIYIIALLNVFYGIPGSQFPSYGSKNCIFIVGIFLVHYLVSSTRITHRRSVLEWLFAWLLVIMVQLYWIMALSMKFHWVEASTYFSYEDFQLLLWPFFLKHDEFNPEMFRELSVKAHRFFNITMNKIAERGFEVGRGNHSY